ncbi:uncharacterized protein SETTUDRAFT_169700 [Exserohilum turcica Et28A]|uniref:Uncharacterized protein n=1 Tax=Exserohilum turcicum (strain 28A) TaxID=671987 RepID=R0KBI7_EXST2|nr:uncharacterized protein SETTUDRAFT_169700 [Exserohilum turcica Et28A]EOA85582.1 hypothetical protein SETTUDRAFT_169700 [Exserohilum turcica Et28A]
MVKIVFNEKLSEGHNSLVTAQDIRLFFEGYFRGCGIWIYRRVSPSNRLVAVKWVVVLSHEKDLPYSEWNRCALVLESHGYLLYRTIRLLDSTDLSVLDRWAKGCTTLEGSAKHIRDVLLRMGSEWLGNC